MEDVKMMERPQRWDEPFDSNMTEADVDDLLKRPELALIDRKKFPPHIPLEGILKNDARIVRYETGDIILREGDYGSSAFLILSGTARVVITPSLPTAMLGRQATKKVNILQSIAQLWTNRKIPEVRDLSSESHETLRETSDARKTRTFLQDIPVILDSYRTAELHAGSLFGELAALGRLPSHVPSPIRQRVSGGQSPSCVHETP